MENSSQKVRYRLTKNERLHSGKLIDKLFAEGKRRVAGCLVANYMVLENSDLPAHVQMMAVVPKKRFKRAVHRNLLKRRIREAYRLNKHELHKHLKNSGKRIIVAFVYRQNEILSYQEIEKSVIAILKHLKSV